MDGRASYSEQFTIASLCHPARAGEMTVMHTPGAYAVEFRINLEDHPNDLFPIGFFRIGIEQPPIDIMMGFVIGGDSIATRRCIKEMRFGHYACLSFWLCDRAIIA